MKRPTRKSLWEFATFGYLGRRLTAPFFAALFYLVVKEGTETLLYGTLIVITAVSIAAIPWIIDRRNGDL